MKISLNEIILTRISIFVRGYLNNQTANYKWYYQFFDINGLLKFKYIAF